MPPFISSAFMFHGRKSYQFYDHEIITRLCPRPDIVNVGTHIKKEESGKSHCFSITRSEDGGRLTLESRLRTGDKNFITQLEAVRVKDNTFEITSLVFDNKTETLTSRENIYNVLSHIGEKQLLATAQGRIAEPHQEKGKFGKLGRFLSACVPDDPGGWVM